MADNPQAGRWKQKKRTRKELLAAAGRLLKAGERPSLEEVADEALVSRATAYRYFPSIDALLIEAALDVAVPVRPHVAGVAAAPVEGVVRRDRPVEPHPQDLPAERAEVLRVGALGGVPGADEQVVAADDHAAAVVPARADR